MGVTEDLGRDARPQALAQIDREEICIGTRPRGFTRVPTAHRPSESSDVSGVTRGLMLKSQQAVVFSLADQEEEGPVL